MPHFQKRGNRIRASDKSLIFRFSAGSLLLLFLAVVLLLNLKTIAATDWKSVHFLQDDSVHLTVTPYMIISVIGALLICGAAALLYRRFQYDRVKRLFHRQKLAKMILENGWYESETIKDSYVEYVLLYDTIANRITIDEVQAEHGSLRLTKNIWWEYEKLPHMLIAGGTGGGKTYFILTIIEALLKCNAVMYVLDPKNADLADLSAVMPEVYYKKEDITGCIDRFYDGMMARSKSMNMWHLWKC